MKFRVGVGFEAKVKVWVPSLHMSSAEPYLNVQAGILISYGAGARSGASAGRDCHNKK